MILAAALWLATTGVAGADDMRFLEMNTQIGITGASGPMSAGLEQARFVETNVDLGLANPALVLVRPQATT